ncbi:unnamed protein product [Echinostoma caproni]|uniref:Uncharacterized protein n=1 Tax=Echinostoma caproni TaxID=27848 RepID=A0A3P8IGC9_9TREM|nr:unnamed protein product [Echinostoma caproni]
MALWAVALLRRPIQSRPCSKVHSSLCATKCGLQVVSSAVGCERHFTVYRCAFTVIVIIHKYFIHSSPFISPHQPIQALNTVQPDTCAPTESDNSDTAELAAQASQWLTRALKFNPQCADAWCELGECCWRQGDPSEAANHFRQALKVNVSLFSQRTTYAYDTDCSYFFSCVWKGSPSI